MKDIAIYGAGGFGREVACLLNAINRKNPEWNFIGFFDDNKPKGTFIDYGEVLGGMDELNSWNAELSVAIAVGVPGNIKELAGRIVNPHISFPNILAPDTVLLDPDRVAFGCGNILCMGCILSTNVHIGDFNVMNGVVTLGHDVRIGSFNCIMSSVNISGNVSVGDRNFFGVKSAVLQGVRIGNDVRIGAGSVVMRNTADNFLYMGNPATKVKF